MRANAPGESVRTMTGNRYTAGADRIARDVSPDDVAELARLGWRRLVAVVAQSVTAMAVSGKPVITTIARRPEAI
jgi:hypothetical protein